MKRLLLLLALAACSDSIGPQDAVGLWELTSVNGQALPVVIYSAPNVDGCDIAVRGGHFELRADGTFDALVEYGTVVAGRLYCYAESVEWGTYTVSGESVTLVGSSGTHTITLDSRGLSKTVDGNRYTYRR